MTELHNYQIIMDRIAFLETNNATENITDQSEFKRQFVLKPEVYEDKDIRGDKTDDFRKQGEYGAKKFIKP